MAILRTIASLAAVGLRDMADFVGVLEAFVANVVEVPGAFVAAGVDPPLAAAVAVLSLLLVPPQAAVIDKAKSRAVEARKTG